MGKPERDPADYDSWEQWQQARQRDGRMPVIAKPVPYAIVGIVLALLLTWLVVDRIGGTLDDEVRRSGTAVTTGDCRRTAARYHCPAEVTWQDGTSTTADILSTEPLSGRVDIEERLSFQASGSSRSARNEPQVWSADHHPDARPWLFPVAYGGVGLLSLVLGGVAIAKGSTWLKRRSQREWVAARAAAERPGGGTTS
jgi:hypothetical protein